MTPLGFLSVIVAMTALAVGASYVQRRRHIRRLQNLATEWKLHYSQYDCFRLAPRVAQKLTMPGAAAVRVSDLLYGLEDRGYRYIFRTEVHASVVLRTKTGVRRVGMFCEPKDAAVGAGIDVLFAPEGLTLMEQYKHLFDVARATRP